MSKDVTLSETETPVGYPSINNKSFREQIKSKCSNSHSITSDGTYTLKDRLEHSWLEGSWTTNRLESKLKNAAPDQPTHKYKTITKDRRHLQSFCSHVAVRSAKYLASALRVEVVSLRSPVASALAWRFFALDSAFFTCMDAEV